MSKLVAITTAVLLSAAAASPAFAKKHHHAAAPAAEPQVLMPAPLIGGAPIRVGNNCYTVHSSDWGAGYMAACAK